MRCTQSTGIVLVVVSLKVWVIDPVDPHCLKRKEGPKRRRLLAHLTSRVPSRESQFSRRKLDPMMQSPLARMSASEQRSSNGYSQKQQRHIGPPVLRHHARLPEWLVQNMTCMNQRCCLTSAIATHSCFVSPHVRGVASRSARGQSPHRPVPSNHGALAGPPHQPGRVPAFRLAACPRSSP